MREGTDQWKLRVAVVVVLHKVSSWKNASRVLSRRIRAREELGMPL